MRWLAIALGSLVAGCAPPSAPIAEPLVPPPPSLGPSYAESHCEPGTSIVYRRRLPGAELRVTFTCQGDHIEAVSLAQEEEQGCDDECGGEHVALDGHLDVAAYDKLRRRIAARIAAGDCRPAERDSAAIISFGTPKFRIDCAYERHRWEGIAVTLERTIASSFEHVDPRDQPQPEDSDFDWPYDPDYWKDELGYYRQTGG